MVAFQGHDFFMAQPARPWEARVRRAPEQSPRSEEALLRVRDLTMQQAHNAHEKRRAEWESLLESAYPGPRVQRIMQPFKSLMAIIEVAVAAK